MSWSDKSNDPSIGRTLLGVTLASDQRSLVLHCDDGADILYTVEGDCCSSSWIEHLTEPEFGGTILSIDEPTLLPHAPITDEEYGEVINVYHTAWKTTKGTLIAEYRNSSNGYYGGWMNDGSLRRNLA